jgi:predicted Fe-Mo cluster-binding NifX family protein
MKIAFTSSDGIMVDTHFGKAEKFYIYEIKKGAVYFRGSRKTESYSTAEVTHVTDYDRLNKIFKTIDDCRILVTASIGETPMNHLQDKGMMIDVARGTINSVFLKL